MMKIFLCLLFLAGFALCISESPYFPLPNVVGLGMLAIFLLKQNAIK